MCHVFMYRMCMALQALYISWQDVFIKRIYVYIAKCARICKVYIYHRALCGCEHRMFVCANSIQSISSMCAECVFMHKLWGSVHTFVCVCSECVYMCVVSVYVSRVDISECVSRYFVYT